MAVAVPVVAAGALLLLAAAAITSTPQWQKAARDMARGLERLLRPEPEIASSEPETAPKPEPKPPPEPKPEPRIPPVALPICPPTVVDCPDRPKDDDHCKQLWEKINDLTARPSHSPSGPSGGFPDGPLGLKYRWRAHACNEGNWSPDSQKARNHLAEYRKQRAALQNREIEIDAAVGRAAWLPLSDWDAEQYRRYQRESPDVDPLDWLPGILKVVAFEPIWRQIRRLLDPDEMLPLFQWAQGAAARKDLSFGEGDDPLEERAPE